jgi:HEAT repeat protein
LAAFKLAEDHDRGAAAAIEEALSREQNIDAQVGLAEALSSLNDEKGVAHLQSMCTDSALSLQSTMSVVRALRLIRSSGSGCTETFLALLSQARDSGELGMAASLLPFLYVDSTPDQAQRIVDRLRTLLLDKAQGTIVRTTCSHALVKIGTLDSAAAIREAIANEQDPSTKSFFENDLRAFKRDRN